MDEELFGVAWTPCGLAVVEMETDFFTDVLFL